MMQLKTRSMYAASRGRPPTNGSGRDGPPVFGLRIDNLRCWIFGIRKSGLAPGAISVYWNIAVKRRWGEGKTEGRKEVETMRWLKIRVPDDLSCPPLLTDWRFGASEFKIPEPLAKIRWLGYGADYLQPTIGKLIVIAESIPGANNNGYEQRQMLTCLRGNLCEN